jgi:hypothetical protein
LAGSESGLYLLRGRSEFRKNRSRIYHWGDKEIESRLRGMTKIGSLRDRRSLNGPIGSERVLKAGAASPCQQVKKGAPETARESVFPESAYAAYPRYARYGTRKRVFGIR